MRHVGYWTALFLATRSLATASGAVVYHDVAQLTAEAQKIVIADVVGVESHWTQNGLIESQITVNVTDYLIGHGSGTEVLQMSGGTVGDASLRVSVLPVLQVGDHVLLFLRDGQPGLVQAFQGAYLTDGQQIVRTAPACGRIIEESLQPLPDFLAQIEQALPPETILARPAEYTGDFVLPLSQPRYALCGSDWTYMTNPMGESYVINANCVDASAGDATSQRTQIQNGPAAWNAAGADFAFTYGGTSTQTSVTYNGTNLVFFSTNPPDGGDYVAATYIWSSGTSITEIDLVFNDRDYTWWNGSGTCSGKMDIWNVATHEYGHWLCLDDLYGGGDSAKTMYGYVSYCDIHARDLHADDINGIIAIYGVTPAPPNDICANATVITSGTYTGDTTYATNDGSASCGTSSTTKDVWFSYTTGTAGTLAVDTCTSAYNTVLSVHTGCPGTSANQLGGSSGCNDNCGGSPCGASASCLSLAVAASTTYYIRVSGYNGASGSYTLHVSGPDPDVTPPTPDPMTFNASPNGTPTAISTSQVTMTATEATDPSGGIEYYFTTSAVSNGANHSGWQASRTYTDDGLQTNRNYAYKVKARDAVPNETADSSFVSVATFIETPTALSFGTITDNSIQVTAPGTFTRLTASSSGLYFEVLDPGDNPVGGAQANAWVQVQTITASGLSPGTTYRFRVKARNYYGQNETPWYPTVGYVSQATTGGATCSLLGDINQDGLINGLDVGGFVRAKLGGSMEPGENAACANYGGTLEQDTTDFVTDLLGL